MTNLRSSSSSLSISTASQRLPAYSALAASRSSCSVATSIAPPGLHCGTKSTWQSCSEATSLPSQLTRYSPLGNSVLRAAVMNSQRLPQPSVSFAITTSLKRSKWNSLPNSRRKAGLRGIGGSSGCSRSYSSSFAGRSRNAT
ncbi:hypothetical protein D3C72_1839510 [compost metagenome]